MLPFTLPYRPTPQGTQAEAVVSGLKVPTPQGAQRELTAEALYLPGTQEVHPVDAVSPLRLLKLPSPQAMHTIAPGLGEYVPAKQLVQFVRPLSAE